MTALTYTSTKSSTDSYKIFVTKHLAKNAQNRYSSNTKPERITLGEDKQHMSEAREKQPTPNTTLTNPEHKGLKIIGAGFGRTGTLSLKVALEELGFGPCYHMTELFKRPADFAFWEAAVQGQTVNWHDLFDTYQATVDWPGCTFYQDLMKVYPDAKVLLTTRNPESWYESAKSTIYQVSRLSKGSLFARLLMRIVQALGINGPRVGGLANTLVWEKTFQGRFDDKAYALEVFKQHIEEVKSYVPADKLLVYEVKEGWEPLCAFLGVAVPDKPFPRLNDRASFGGNIAVRQVRQRVGASALIAGASLTFLLLLLFKRRQK